MSEQLENRLKESGIFDDEVWEENFKTLAVAAGHSLDLAEEVYRDFRQQALKNKEQALKFKKKIDDLTEALADFNKHTVGPVVGGRLPLGFVMSISKAAKNGEERAKYYRHYLEKEHIRGGFVAHRMFIHFVKGARGEYQWKESGLERFRTKASGLVHALANRNDFSFLAKCQGDHESPQSLVASELLRMAVDVIGVVQAEEDVQEDHIPGIFVSHQGEIKRDSLDPDQVLIARDKNSVEYKVDVMATVISEGFMKIIATMEYKPDKRAAEARIAQRDMYATNTISLHNRPCIGVDIAGGNDVEQWKVTAMAYFANPRETTLFECSEMYCGDGLEALFSVALGLRLAAKSWRDDAIAEEYRLGPVVARLGERVYKAYDDPTYRRPNLDIVKAKFDETATAWESEDGKLTILETNYVQSCWRGAVSSSVFVDIIGKLGELHEEQMIHGDIRLANLLHSGDKGFIIDFDFVGHVNYPPGLKKLTLDGKRHKEVDKAIDEDNTEQLRMTAAHDRFSLGEVMRLFVCDQNENESRWEKAIEECQGNNPLNVVVDLLNMAPFSVKAGRTIESVLPFETGPTPRKHARKMVGMESIEEDTEKTALDY